MRRYDVLQFVLSVAAIAVVVLGPEAIMQSWWTVAFAWLVALLGASLGHERGRQVGRSEAALDQIPSAAFEYLGSGLAAFAAARQAERAALTHEEADEVAQHELGRWQPWLGCTPQEFAEFMDERKQEFRERYPTWKG